MSSRTQIAAYLNLFSIDLVLIGLLGFWTVILAGLQVGSFPGRVAVGVVAILFAPGYALVSALFPRKNSDTGLFEGVRAEVTGKTGRITVVERLVLAVCLSVCLVPLLGIGLGLAQIEIQPSSMMGTVGITTISLIIIASIRRTRVLPWERFDPQIGDFFRSMPTRLQTQSTLTVLLVLGFVVAGTGIGIAVMDADRGEQFTELSLLTEDEETGELVADGYPEELTQNNTDTLHISITNNEGKTVTYTVVTALQSFNEAGQLQEMEILDTFQPTVQDGETVREQRTISPESTGENLRLTYLLYKGAPPENGDPSTDNAYRYVHIWVNVPS